MPAKFSRTGVTNPLGKFTAEFPKFKGPEETREIADKLAREAGMTLAEWQRELVMARCHGVERMRSLYSARLSVVVGKGDK